MTPMTTWTPTTTTTTTTTTTVKVPKFLRCLYDILHFEDRRILSWSHDGSYFQVFDTTRLEKEVLPKYFKHSKLTSFQRQLNNFGFHKWTKTRANVCTFSHDALAQCHPSRVSSVVATTYASWKAASSGVQNQEGCLMENCSPAMFSDSSSSSKRQKIYHHQEPELNFEFDVDELLLLLASDSPQSSDESADTTTSEPLSWSLPSKDDLFQPLSVGIPAEAVDGSEGEWCPSTCEVDLDIFEFDM